MYSSSGISSLVKRKGIIRTGETKKKKLHVRFSDHVQVFKIESSLLSKKAIVIKKLKKLQIKQFILGKKISKRKKICISTQMSSLENVKAQKERMLFEKKLKNVVCKILILKRFYSKNFDNKKIQKMKCK